MWKKHDKTNEKGAGVAKTFIPFFDPFPMDVKKPFYKDVSFWVLILSNVLTMSIAAREAWSLLTIAMVYWLQSVIIGFFNFIRMLSVTPSESFYVNKVPVIPAGIVKHFLAGFFAFHYGFFHLVYGVFLLVFAFTSDLELNILHVLGAGIIFFVDHLFSFKYNRERDEKKGRSIVRLMLFPYARVIPMHVVIITLGFSSSGQDLLLFFLGLKTIADAVMHVIEHG